jgi:hypothetical protein
LCWAPGRSTHRKAGREKYYRSRIAGIATEGGIRGDGPYISQSASAIFNCNLLAPIFAEFLRQNTPECVDRSTSRKGDDEADRVIWVRLRLHTSFLRENDRNNKGSKPTRDFSFTSASRMERSI